MISCPPPSGCRVVIWPSSIQFVYVYEDGRNYLVHSRGIFCRYSLETARCGRAVFNLPRFLRNRIDMGERFSGFQTTRDWKAHRILRGSYQLTGADTPHLVPILKRPAY